MTERETVNTLLAISKKEGSLLASFEALGRVIEELKSEIRIKDYRIAELEEKLADPIRRRDDVQN